MFRFSLVLLGMLISARVPAAPVPTHLMPKSPEWFPTTVGATWVLEIDGRETTETISAVERRNGDTIITIEYVNGEQRSPSAVLRMNKDGVCRLSLRGSEYVDPYWLIKTPARPGVKWDFAVRFKLNNAAGATGTKTIGETGEFELNGRKYVALSVVTTNPGSDVSFTSWYAPGLGFVKQTGRFETIMKSFNPGPR